MYPALSAVYAAHQAEAEADGLYLHTYLPALRGQLARGADLVLDRSFYARSNRDTVRPRWLLVFLRPCPTRNCRAAALAPAPLASRTPQLGP